MAEQKSVVVQFPQQTVLKFFPLKDILPNPFRNEAEFPLVQKKVDDLRESIRTTGYWKNIVARIGPDGRPEVAYGHHRLAALRAEFPGTYPTGLIIEEHDDAEMLQIMLRENSETYSNDLDVLQAGIYSTIKAYGNGRIPPERAAKLGLVARVDKTTRYAPSFVPDEQTALSAAYPYNAVSLAKFAGQTKQDGYGGVQANDRIMAVLAALELIEMGLIGWEHVKGMETKQRLAYVRGVKQEHERLVREAEEKEKQAAKLREEEAEKRAAVEREQKRLAEQAEKQRLQLEAENDKKKAEQAQLELKRKQDEAAKKQIELRETAASARVIEKQAQKMKQQASPVEFKKVAEKVQAEIRKPEERPTIRKIKEAIQRSSPRKNKELPDIGKVADQVATKINGILTSDSELHRRVKELMKFQEDMKANDRRYLRRALYNAGERFTKLADGFKE